MDLEELEDGGIASETSNANGRMAMALAAAGFVPFAVLSIWLLAIDPAHPWRAQTIFALKTHAALILAFLGGIRWGLAMRDDDIKTGRVLAASILPMIAGWLCLLVPDLHAFATLAVCFAAMGAWDQFSVHAGQAPAWYGKVRVRFTLLVTISMLAALLAVA